MNLAILVVYFLDKRDEQLLDIHLKFIEKYTDVPYTIYAATNRLLPNLVERLAQYPQVKICELPDTDLRVSLEHAFYIEGLTRAAIKDGATHLCTLDVDSFPIRYGWATELGEAISDDRPVAAILRKENGDEVLTHPSCLFFSHDFYEKYKPRYFPRPKEIFDPAYWLFFYSHLGECDTGIGFSYILRKNNLNWYRILRSNRYEDHYIMGGIYGDMIFHLGASSRGIKIFKLDRKNVKLPLKLRILHGISKFLPIPVLRDKLKAYLQHNIYTLLDSQIKKNDAAYVKIRSSLLKNPESYIEQLTYP